MKRPKSVKVGAFVYRVRWDGAGLAKNDAGACFYDRQTISVRKGLTEQSQRATLFHELLHAVWGNAGLLDGVSEEDAVGRLETGLLALFKDNPGLAEFLGILPADSA